MTRWIKDIVPLGLRTRLKWLGFAAQDILNPIKAPRVPARRDTFIGGGDFEAVGDSFLKTLIRHGLAPDMQVLDVGCGQGRMARPLVDVISDGSYTGFDIVKDGIEWCRREYADVPNFSFIHADVFNARYNPGGQVLAADYVFPAETGQFDLSFLTSVFTHMFKRDVENYLSEIARTLKPGGTCLITWFLLNPESRSIPSAKMDFRFDYDDVSKTTVRENPEAALAFDEAYMRGLYDRFGLDIITIEYGQWAKADSPFDFQDLVVARKN